MLINAPAKRFQRREGKARPVRALLLVSAQYTPESGPTPAYVTLTFDRPVDASGADSGTVYIEDGAPVETRYRGDGAAVAVSANVVRVNLLAEGSFAGEGTTMTVLPANGIRAEDDGGTWAGVVDLALPYPPPTGPVLVSATWETDAFVLLTFDRDVELSESADPSQLRVDDQSGTGWAFIGTESTLAGPQQVHVEITHSGSAVGTGVKLTAGEGFGVVAADGDAPWVGVSDLELPFP